MEKRTTLVALLLVVATIPATGTTIGAAETNEPPLADAGLDQTVTVGDDVLLDGGGSRDPDGTIESYDWQVTGPNDSTITPDCSSCERTTFSASRNGTYEVELTVTDDDGASRSDALYVTAETGAGPTVSLTGPDETTSGNEERYHTSADAGDHYLDEVVWRIDGSVVRREDAGGRHARLTLGRALDAPGEHDVTVTVIDSAGQRVSDDLAVSVASSNSSASDDADSGSSSNLSVSGPCTSNTAPDVTLSGFDAVEPGSYETFTASASDPDGEIVDYDWSNAMLTDGSDPTEAGHQFTEGEGNEVPLSVTVEDNCGTTATDSKTVRIEETPDPQVSIDAPPVVEACEDTDVDLTASAEHFDAPIDDYTWSSNVDSSNWRWSSVSMNRKEDGNEIQVSVTVEDLSGNTASDTATIQIHCRDQDNEQDSTSINLNNIHFEAIDSDDDNVDSPAALHENIGLPGSEDTITFETEATASGTENVEFEFDFGDGGSTTVTDTPKSNNRTTAKTTYAYDVKDELAENGEGSGPATYSETARLTVTAGNRTSATRTVEITWVDAKHSDGRYSITVKPLDDEVEKGDRAGFDVELSGTYDGSVKVDLGDGSTDTVRFSVSADATSAGSMKISETQRVHNIYSENGSYSVTAAPQTHEGRGSGDTAQITVTDAATSAAQQQIASHSGNTLSTSDSGSSSASSDSDTSSSSYTGSSSTTTSYTRDSSGSSSTDSGSDNDTDDSSGSSSSTSFTSGSSTTSDSDRSSTDDEADDDTSDSSSPDDSDSSSSTSFFDAYIPSYPSSSLSSSSNGHSSGGSVGFR